MSNLLLLVKTYSESRQLASTLVMPTLLTFASQKLSKDVGAKAGKALACIDAADEFHACDRESVFAQIFAITLRREAGQEELMGQLIAQFLGNVFAVHASVVQGICHATIVARRMRRCHCETFQFVRKAAVCTEALTQELDLCWCIT